MAATFAALEARVNRAVISRVANAAVVLGAATFYGIFDKTYVDPLGITSSEPRLVAKSTDVASATLGTPITVNGTAYTVREKQPDGTGMTTLLLEAA